MGCTCCCPLPGPNDGPVHGIKPRAIIVWRGANLKHGDIIGSDPYCVVRVGEAGTTWDAKPRSVGRRGSPSSEKTNPVWNFGFAAETAGIAQPEVHVRVYDADIVGDDDFLGEAKILLGSLSDAQAELPLSGGEGVKGSVFVSGGAVEMLAQSGIKPWGVGYEDVAPIGGQKIWNLADASTAIPMLVGTAPLPPAMRGIFWLDNQQKGSALVSLGGPSRDGGGCSNGHLVGNFYSVRVSGDRVWSYADDREERFVNFTRDVDLVYHFAFDNAQNPKKCQIYPEMRRVDLVWVSEWLLDFEMHLKEEGDEQYPGSVIWRRPNFTLGQNVYEYALIQVIDENGNRIQPAWDKFVEYQSSAVAGNTPGKIFYREIEA